MAHRRVGHDLVEACPRPAWRPGPSRPSGRPPRPPCRGRAPPTGWPCRAHAARCAGRPRPRPSRAGRARKRARRPAGSWARRPAPGPARPGGSSRGPSAFTDVSARCVMPTSSSVASTRSISSLVGLLMFRRSRHRRPSPLARPLGDQEVVAHGHVGEHLDPLVRAADAEAGPPVGGQADQRRPVEDDLAHLGAQLPADAVEQRRLAGAVRARPGRRSRRRATSKRDVVHGLDPAERLAHAAQGRGAGSRQPLACEVDRPC